MMRLNQSDIIEDVLAHIRQCGGEFSEWCVGTAKDSAFLRQHGPESAAEGLIYREAYTLTPRPRWWSASQAAACAGSAARRPVASCLRDGKLSALSFQRSAQQ